MIVASALSAIAQYSFVAPNNFARGGIAGIALILNHIYPQLYLGLFNILVNIPLLAVSCFSFAQVLYRHYGYIGISSVAMIVAEAIDARAGGVLRYVEAGTPILSAVFSGAIIGVSFAMMTRIGGSLGGTDIIAAIIRKTPRRRRFVVRVPYGFHGCSRVVFRLRNDGGVTALVLTFMISTVGDKFIQGGKAAIKVEIVTRHADEICAEIFEKIGRGVTVIDGVVCLPANP
ncbi:MAG: YitT family protein [Christensenellales bacterium]